jgi:Arc/MetJ-type ribon-helix-helix transcriptional regulator
MKLEEVRVHLSQATLDKIEEVWALGKFSSKADAIAFSVRIAAIILDRELKGESTVFVDDENEITQRLVTNR